MKITYFFRKPSPAFHSIEEQFFNMQSKLNNECEFVNVFAKYHSKGFFRRIFIMVQAFLNQNQINHITGDINFISLFLKKSKTILTVHDIGSAIYKPGYKGKILKWFWFTIPFCRVKYITVISEFTKQEILSNFKINSNKIIVIPNCVSPQIVYSPKEFNSDKTVILQIGTKTNKNIEKVIVAIKDIPCKFIVVGKLSETQTELLSKHNIDFENHFNIDYSKIIDLYKLADIVTFVSTYEGFGVPVLEAQATGRVIITSNISPMKDIAGEAAMLVNPNDVEEISFAIKKVISDSAFRNSLINLGSQNVKKSSAESVAEEYFNLYKKISI